MFQNTLSQFQSKLSHTPGQFQSYTAVSMEADFDLQYELYSRYMHISKEQLAVQELILMKDSQALLESINLSGKSDTSRDIHSTMDSVCCDEDFENSLVHDFSVIEKRSPKKITRKGTRQSILKPIGRNNDDFAEILNEIERNCSEKTFTSVKTLIEEHKKNISRMVEVEKKQKNVRRLQEKTDRLEQENAIFKLKLGELQQKIKSKDEDIKGLKDKLNQLRTTQKQNIRSQKRLLSSATKSTAEDQRQTPSNNIPSPAISLYLNQKQTHLKQRMGKVQQIQTRIQHLIESSVISVGSNESSKNSKEETCNKCCQMIKKIKESVMKYRQYLEEQGDQSEKLYNMLKAQVQNCLTDRKIDSPNF